MNPSASPHRLVSGAAVLAVSVAALCAAWVGRSPEAAAPVLQVQRPAANGPVRVVKSPQAPAPQPRPASR